MCPKTRHVLAAIGTLVPCDDPSQQRVRAGSPGRLSGAFAEATAGGSSLWPRPGRYQGPHDRRLTPRVV